jgi:tRNA guanosine-2'-O-methyltransferase
MKKDGYSLVGLEQTSNSVQLQNYTFPSNVVLVLGHEKEGIPANILLLLDCTGQ